MNTILIGAAIGYVMGGAKGALYGAAIGYYVRQESPAPKTAGLSGTKQDAVAAYQALWNTGWRPGQGHAEKNPLAPGWGLAPDRSGTNPALLRRKRNTRFTQPGGNMRNNWMTPGALNYGDDFSFHGAAWNAGGGGGGE